MAVARTHWIPLAFVAPCWILFGALPAIWGSWGIVFLLEKPSLARVWIPQALLVALAVLVVQRLGRSNRWVAAISSTLLILLAMFVYWEAAIGLTRDGVGQSTLGMLIAEIVASSLPILGASLAASCLSLAGLRPATQVLAVVSGLLLIPAGFAALILLGCALAGECL